MIKSILRAIKGNPSVTREEQKGVVRTTVRNGRFSKTVYSQYK